MKPKPTTIAAAALLLFTPLHASAEAAGPIAAALARESVRLARSAQPRSAGAGLAGRPRPRSDHARPRDHARRRR